MSMVIKVSTIIVLRNGMSRMAKTKPPIMLETTVKTSAAEVKNSEFFTQARIKPSLELRKSKMALFKSQRKGRVTVKVSTHRVILMSRAFLDSDG